MRRRSSHIAWMSTGLVRIEHDLGRNELGAPPNQLSTANIGNGLATGYGKRKTRVSRAAATARCRIPSARRRSLVHGTSGNDTPVRARADEHAQLATPTSDAVTIPGGSRYGGRVRHDDARSPCAVDVAWQTGHLPGTGA